MPADHGLPHDTAMPRSPRLAAAALAAALSAAACTVPGIGHCGTPQCAQDAELVAAVSQRINEHPSLRFFNLRIQASEGNVYLLGAVDTEVDRALAEDVARAVPGVRQVYNGLGLNGNDGYGFRFY